MSSVGINLIDNAGLANRLFMVAFIYSYAKKYNKKFGFVKNGYNKHSSIDYLTTIYPFLIPITLNYPIHFHEPEEKSVSYIDIPNYNRDCLFTGYFQCEKYFIDYKKEIQELFQLPQLSFQIHKKSIYLHLRRTDYVNHPVHNINLNKYYDECIKYVQNKEDDFIIYVVSDDIEYCKKEKLFENNKSTIIYIENLNELETLSLMKSCTLGGICANSSFSWWGGYLNPSEEKMVFFPSKWFNNPKYASFKNDIPFKGSYVCNLETYEINRVE